MLIAMLLCQAGFPAFAQEKPRPAEVVVEIVEEEELDDAPDAPDFDEKLEKIEEMRRLMQALQDRERLDPGDRDEIQDRLRNLLLELKLERQQAEQVPQQDWPAEGVVVIQGRAMQAKPYTDPLADLSRDEVLKLLNDPDFKVREQAEANLLADDTLDRAALGKLIQEAQSSEQRYRLIRIAEHHVMREIREQQFGGQEKLDEEDEPILRGFNVRETAAIGFSYQPMLVEDNPQTQTPAVTVTATMPGFPGHAHLRPGDLVVAVNGQTAQGIRHRELITDWMGNRIAFHHPGDTITLTIVRNGEALDIKIVAAEGTALRLMYTSNGFNAAFRERPYNEQWLKARAELTKDLPQPTALTPDE